MGKYRMMSLDRMGEIAYGGVNGRSNPVEYSDSSSSDLMKGIQENYVQNQQAANQMGNTGGMGFGDYAQIAAQGLQALTGLGNIYNAYQQNKFAKEQFAFQKSMALTNLSNQAKIINNQYNSAANISAQLGATTPGESGSAIIESYKKKAKANHVAGALS